MRLSFFQEVLLATAAGLAVLLMVELSLLTPESFGAGRGTAAESVLPSLEPAAEEQLGFALPPRKSLSAFVERPLFERSRRAAGASAADIMLVGTVIAASETVAILQADGGKPVRARVGDVVGAWRVLQISQDGALVSNNESEQWLSAGAQN